MVSRPALPLHDGGGSGEQTISTPSAVPAPSASRQGMSAGSSQDRRIGVSLGGWAGRMPGAAGLLRVEHLAVRERVEGLVVGDGVEGAFPAVDGVGGAVGDV